MKSSYLRHRHTVGVSRRELLQVGYSGFIGLALPTLLGRHALAAKRNDRSSGRAKSVIVIFLTGAPSHIDMFDMKPEAPDRIRGDFTPIATTVPGVQICEHMPRLASRTDKLAILRTMSHKEHNHLLATHKVLTGRPTPNKRGASDLDRVASRDDFPCYASALDYVRPRHDGVPSGVTLPTYLVEGPLTWPGQHAGFLGVKHDPWQIKQDPNDPEFRVESLSLREGVSMERLNRRWLLLDRISRQRDHLTTLAESSQFPDQQRLAFSMLTSGKIAQAFEIQRESTKVRDRYGRHTFGQSLLLARRLVQAGVPIVQANMGIVQTWDTHVANFPKLKDRLLPQLDQSVAALLDDLVSLGMLDETLLVMLGEFGRTPKISMLPGETVPGRDHWAPVFSAVFAGAGVQGGQVIGQSDKIGAYPVTRPYFPADLATTVFRALGVDPANEVHDRLGRPMRLSDGEIMEPLYSGSARS